MTLFEILVYSIVIVKAFFAPSNAPVRSTRPTPVPSAGATLYQYAALSFGIEQGGRGRRRLAQINNVDLKTLFIRPRLNKSAKSPVE